MTLIRRNSQLRVMPSMLALLAEHPRTLLALLLSAFLGIFTEGLGLGVILPLLQPELAMTLTDKLPFLSSLTQWLSTMDIGTRVKVAAGLLFLLTLIRASMAVVTQLLTLKLQKNIEYALKMRAFTQIHDLELQYIYSQKMSGLLITINRYTWQAAGMMNTVISSISSLFTLVVYFFIMLYVSWHLTLVASLLLLIIVVIGYHLLFARLQDFGVGEVRSQRALRDIALESLSAIKLLHLFNQRKSSLNKYRNALDEHQHYTYGGRKLAILLKPLFVVACAVTVSTALYLVASFNPDDLQQWLGLIVLFLIIVFRLMSPAANLFNAIGQIRKFAPAFEELMSFIDRTDKTYLVDGSRTITTLRDAIIFENVSFTYNVNTLASLRGASFTIPKGCVTALVGKSGSGKSTIVDLLARLYDCATGQITIDGFNIKDYRLDDWRSLLAVVDQDTFLFNGSVSDNLRCVKPDASDTELKECAQQADAHEFIMSLPKQYETILGDRGVRLSGGQRQRIAIARAILSGPDLLVLDEATSDLDAETERSIQSAIENFGKTRSVLVVAHRLSTVKYADNIIVLDQGAVVEQGDWDALMLFKGKFWELVGMQRFD